MRTTALGALLLVLVLGACRDDLAAGPSSCEEIVEEAAALLAETVEAYAAEADGAGPRPAPVLSGDEGESIEPWELVHAFEEATGVDLAPLQERAERLRQAQEEMDCGGPGWANEPVGDMLLNKLGERMSTFAERVRERASDQNGQPELTTTEQTEMNVLAQVATGLRGGEAIDVELDP